MLNEVAAARDEGSRRQVRRGRVDPALRAPVGRGDEEGGRADGDLPGEAGGLHQGEGRAGDRLRRRPRHRQEPGQHDPGEQRLHRLRPGQAGAAEHDHRQGGGGRGRRDRPERAARLDLKADARLREGVAPPGARLPGDHRRRGDQSRLRAAHPLRGADTPYSPGVFYAQDAFEGLHIMDALSPCRGERDDFRRQIIDEAFEAQGKLEQLAASRAGAATVVVPARSNISTTVPVPTPPSGACGRCGSPRRQSIRCSI